MVRKEVKRRTSLLMGISLALLLGAAAAFFVFALPQNLLERITVFVGLSRLMVQAEPPISPNDRALLAALAGIGTMGLGWVLIDWLLFGRAGMSALIRPREDDYEDDDDGYRPSDPLDLVTPAPRAIDLPIPNPADTRRPLSARTDIGDPPRPPVFAPPPLDRLFVEAAREPAPPPPPASIADQAGAGLLDPANIFKGLSAKSAIVQPPQMPPAPQVNTVAPAPVDPWISAREAGFQAAPPAAVQSPPPRAEGTPDLRMESFPPDLPDLPVPSFFATPPARAAFVPPPEPQPVAQAPPPPLPPITEPIATWSPPGRAAPEPPPADMPLEDMLARLELGMQKRRRALAIAPPTEAPAAPQRPPLPAYAAAPAPYRESPPPSVPASSPPDGDGLLDQPLNVALGVLRNLVRG